jgi:hypothetical protein
MYKPSVMRSRGALVVEFMPLHGVYKCKMCVKHVIISYRIFQEIFIFSEYFSIFRKTKICFLRYLKIL